ncbi:MAG: hypothetical protein A3B86_03595 [Candidatus Yanofskybacteria bacterium RIFCSPHIGHO2_02_FULL_38_22b]|uniref:Uncharacterized protein n=1 Tax=Candidatus Yanofskybacteria bacterium RIFCSPHIGHO2_02_FULL_38_22b TaxID=1802673 RepID=A0A1F8F044_9BACT|nr:MAG: hypothetical protein A3B86_03595 [Candidatus Yanofskybacteria bacterium RIFCSPHIGHO2_02_FULL_38_22b]OGN19469.1 MAG: hypothetical protein A2910_02975 [Candidatus Yanofskybacteria bacterium RIFCSPLOWO2_01_FULL_39_28]
MRSKGSWSDATYRSRVSEAEEKGAGRATFKGEERARQGEALDPLVDPSKYTDQNKRGSNTLLVPEGDEFVAPFGVAIPVQSDLDTTGSMGGNVDLAFKALPKVQNLLIQGENAVLKRYHTQIATGIVQDRVDQYPYLRTMFEPDNEVERQMGLLVPNRSGGDATEDYQLGLFMAVYLTKLSINDYGLKGYYFVVGDERGRDKLDARVLEQVFGSDVLERAFGSNPTKVLPSTSEIAGELVKNWYPFYLQVYDNPYATDWWAKLFGKDHVVKLPRTEDLAEVQAVIIGLTEGVLDLQNAVEFLGGSKSDRGKSSRIVEAVSGIPIGLQASYPNFNKIPLAGARFKGRDDIWPIGTSVSKKEKTRPLAEGKKSGKKGKDWKI